MRAERENDEEPRRPEVGEVVLYNGEEVTVASHLPGFTDRYYVMVKDANGYLERADIHDLTL